MSEEKHTIRNGVISGVISGLLIALILWLIPGLWVWLISVATRLYGFLIATVAIPVWLLGVMILAIIPTIIGIIILIVVLFNRPTPIQPTWFDYKTDYFDGMKCRWEYIDNQITNVRCYCPNDETRLVVVDESAYENTIFFCETCKTSFGPFRGRFQHNVGRIERQIERKIRTGEWKEAVQTVKAS